MHPRHGKYNTKQLPTCKIDVILIMLPFCYLRYIATVMDSSIYLSPSLGSLFVTLGVFVKAPSCPIRNI